MPKSILFTEAELETIERAMDDYMCYHDPNIPASDLIGGLPVDEFGVNHKPTIEHLVHLMKEESVREIANPKVWGK